MQRNLLLGVSLLGMWLIPAFEWIRVLDKPLTGYEVVPLTGLLPWMLLLFVFIARYVNQPRVVTVIGSIFLVGIAIWVGTMDFLGSPAVEEAFQSLTGRTFEELGPELSVSWVHFVYSGSLLLAAFSLLLGPKNVRKNTKIEGEANSDARSLWDEQI